MNKVRRKSLGELADRIEEINEELQAILEEEQVCYDNMPEGIQSSERGDIAQEAIDNMDNAISSLEEAKDYITSAAE